MNLNSSIHDLISEATKHEIATQFWGPQFWQPHQSPNSSQMDKYGLDSYFEYYTEQCGKFFKSDEWPHTHQDIVDISKLLCPATLVTTRDSIKDHIKQQYPTQFRSIPASEVDERIYRSIDLTIRLVLMIRFGGAPNTVFGFRTLSWNTQDSLKEFLGATFKARGSMNKDRVRLEKIFTARNFERIAGLNIVLTSNLADHLRILDDETQVAIFHHAYFLKMAKRSPLWPAKLIEETEQTLKLLFPQTKETEHWLKKLSSQRGYESLDKSLAQVGRLGPEDRQIDQFEIWRDRLVMLKQLFDEKEPTSWTQWWYDRRRGLQRYPFIRAFIALGLTVIFSLIQCVEGAIQVYKAYHPST